MLTDSRLLGCLDIFPNIDRIKKVNCPVLIMHGKKDEEVPWHHGARLNEAVPAQFRRPPWFVDRGHNDMCDGDDAEVVEYYEQLRGFLSSLPNIVTA